MKKKLEERATVVSEWPELTNVSYQQLSAYQNMLNERPRKIVGRKPPAQCVHDPISKTPSS